MKIVLKVNGIECSGCENRIQKSLIEITGISSVKASHETGSVEISSNETIDIDKIKERLDILGFEVVEIIYE